MVLESETVKPCRNEVAFDAIIIYNDSYKQMFLHTVIAKDIFRLLLYFHLA